jgi:hypothetical protein
LTFLSVSVYERQHAILVFLNMMSSSSVHFVANDRISLLWPYFPFFIYSSVDWHLGWFHILAIVNNTTLNMASRYLFSMLTSYPLDISLGVG